MKLLFDDELAPMTSEIGFIERPVGEVVSWFVEWDRGIQTPRNVQVRDRAVEGTLGEMLLTLLPLTSVLRSRFLFVPTNSDWTAYFENGHRGTDAMTLTHVAGEKECRAIRMVVVPSGSRRHPATMFSLYGPDRSTFRTIAAVSDGGRWSFEAHGEPLAGEATSDYTARRIRDRFSPHALETLLRTFGIDAFNEAFYAPQRRAVLIERVGQWSVTPMKDYSLEEARALFSK
jgi:hypothetical protein